MRFRNEIEEEDTRQIVESEYVNWNYYKGSTILVTGATGMIGSQIVSSILLANEIYKTNINVLACVRNFQKAQKIFGENFEKLNFIVQDITEPLKIDDKIDSIIHTANSTSSKDFVEYPVETINSIVFGTKNILDFAKEKKVKSVVYLSSMEVFGKTDFDRKEPLKESDYGYIDLSEARSSYPEGKRLAENLCTAYSKEYSVPVKVARLVQTIGANVDYNDKRVFVQFAKSVAENKDIILHTTGETVRSYCYITDAITAIFTILERGQNGEIYNISNLDTTCSIREMAQMLCDKYKNSKLKININDKFYPPISNLTISSDKLKKLNWQPKVNLGKMYENLISIFKDK